LNGEAQLLQDLGSHAAVCIRNAGQQRQKNSSSNWFKSEPVFSKALMKML